VSTKVSSTGAFKMYNWKSFLSIKSLHKNQRCKVQD